MQDIIEIFSEGERVASAHGNTALINFYESKIQEKVRPLNFLIKFNLSTAYQKSNNAEKTVSLLKEIIHEKPGFINAYFNLGVLNDQLGKVDAAIACWDNVEEKGNPQQADQRTLIIQSLNQRARLEENRKNYSKSIQYLKRSLLLDAEQPAAIQHLVRSRQMIFEWPAFQPFGKLSEYSMMVATSPISMLAINDDPRMQLLSSVAFCARTYTEKVDRLPQRKVNPKRKTRIGYVSGDFCTHAVGLLLPDFLANHDRESFDVYGYDFGYKDGSSLRERILGSFDVVRDILNISDSEAARLIHNDEIDILIDMHGLSAKARPYIFAYRPAPLQVCWLGYIGTTSFPWIDCLVLDEFTFLNENTVYTSEKVIKLSQSFLPGRTASSKAGQLEDIQFSDPSGPESNSRLYGCLNNSYKINPDVISLWSEILKSNKESRLLLCKDSVQVSQKILACFKALGVKKDRVDFIARGTYQQYLTQLALIDVYLDTFPYGAGSVARDVVESSVPMVTLAGRTPVSRMCGGVLKEYGLLELVADDKAQYKQKALNAMNDRQRLKELMRSHNLQAKDKVEQARCQEFEQKLLAALTHKLTA
jgi:predicted O-linked N-acetylglucosamine transferase (SPINDLY family)